MKTRLLDIELKNGLLMAILLGIYFLTLSVLRLSGNIYFKAGNAIIAAWVIYHTIKTSKVVYSETYEGTYFNHFFSGLKTGFFGTLMALVGLAVFLIAFPSSYEDMLRASVIPVSGLWQLFVSLLIEGVSGSVIISLVLMQYWKNYEYKRTQGFVERTQ
ncbi:hypothetical protein [Parvicella tangerina]|uniref:DUF4199 domain-containing protein n=1 Tax=Parvicella tangerina TaxID=2829795 RepID=A0A916JMU3_9FLAO|nr:hypothetical protein [Parvicella tangerina]CAG5081637.1 hypothetical protein CRYO30217_01690 [Parvicella tangerina]